MEDWELKDLILKRLSNLKDGSFCNEDSVSKSYGISTERALTLLEEIYSDSRCSKEQTVSLGKTYRKFTANEDTLLFIKDGGYTRQHKLLRSENWPKRNWKTVALIAYVSGLLSPLIVEYSIRKIWPEPTLIKKENLAKPDTNRTPNNDTLPQKP